MSAQLLKNHPNWQDIMARLGERLYKKYIEDEAQLTFDFDYGSDLDDFKNAGKMALATELFQLKENVLSHYKGRFALELEGRLTKESQYFQKRFREATLCLVELVKEECLNDAENFKDKLRSQIKSALLATQNQFEVELSDLLAHEKNLHSQNLKDFSSEGESFLMSEKKSLEAKFKERLIEGKRQLDLEFRKTHEEKTNTARVNLENSLGNYSKLLEAKHAEELTKYQESLNAKLKQELTSWLEVKLHELNRSKEEVKQVKLTSLQEQYLEEIQTSKSKYLSQLDAWTAAIKTQVRAKVAKEQKQLMEQEAAQMLRDLAAGVNHVNLQANLHIDSLETKNRA